MKKLSSIIYLSMSLSITQINASSSENLEYINAYNIAFKQQFQNIDQAATYQIQMLHNQAFQIANSPLYHATTKEIIIDTLKEQAIAVHITATRNIQSLYAAHRQQILQLQNYGASSSSSSR